MMAFLVWPLLCKCRMRAICAHFNNKETCDRVVAPNRRTSMHAHCCIFLSNTIVAIAGVDIVAIAGVNIVAHIFVIYHHGQRI